MGQTYPESSSSVFRKKVKEFILFYMDLTTTVPSKLRMSKKAQ